MGGLPIVEPAVAPLIYGDVVLIEMKADVVWCHVLSRHAGEDGTEELHRQAVVILTRHAFAEALEAANTVARQQGAGHTHKPLSARRKH